MENMEQYDTIILGYPNWWASIPMPVASCLGEYGFMGVSCREQVADAVKALSVVLTAEEMAEMEQAAAETGVNTRVHGKNDDLIYRDVIPSACIADISVSCVDRFALGLL